LVKLDRALAEENAPIRSEGPSILVIGGLVVKQLFCQYAHNRKDKAPLTGRIQKPD
jgi:hypothetical protein